MKKSELIDYPTMEIPSMQVIWQVEGRKEEALRQFPSPIHLPSIQIIC